MLWKVAEKKNMKSDVVGRWGSHKKLVLMSEGRVFRPITFVVCSGYYWSCSCLPSANPCNGRGSDLLRVMVFTLFSFFFLSLSLLSTLSPSILLWFCFCHHTFRYCFDIQRPYCKYKSIVNHSKWRKMRMELTII